MKNPKTNDPEELISRALRGKLTEQEQTEFQKRLEAEPALREKLEEERALEGLLDRAASLPVASNFTSLVLQEVRRNQRESSSRFDLGRSWFRFTFARIATGLGVVLAAGLLGLQQYRQAERRQMARSVSAFTEVASAISSAQTPPTAVFQDFEAIQHLSLPPEAELDLELLVALQK